jgi:hypothetical protein
MVASQMNLLECSFPVRPRPYIQPIGVLLYVSHVYWLMDYSILLQIVCCCFHAQKEAAFLCVADLVVLCLVRVWWSCVWPFVPLYFGPFGTVSPLNLMMRSSPACSRKKNLLQYAIRRLPLPLAVGSLPTSLLGCRQPWPAACRRTTLVRPFSLSPLLLGPSLPRRPLLGLGRLSQPLSSLPMTWQALTRFCWLLLPPALSPTFDPWDAVLASVLVVGGCVSSIPCGVMASTPSLPSATNTGPTPSGVVVSTFGVAALPPSGAIATMAVMTDPASMAARGSYSSWPSLPGVFASRAHNEVVVATPSLLLLLLRPSPSSPPRGSMTRSRPSSGSRSAPPRMPLAAFLWRPSVSWRGSLPIACPSTLAILRPSSLTKPLSSRTFKLRRLASNYARWCNLILFTLQC